jgi:hypothetical protein
MRAAPAEAVARLVHGDAEPLVLLPGQPASDAEQHPPSGQVVEQRDLLGDPQGVVPGRITAPVPSRMRWVLAAMLARNSVLSGQNV